MVIIVHKSIENLWDTKGASLCLSGLEFDGAGVDHLRVSIIYIFCIYKDAGLIIPMTYNVLFHNNCRKFQDIPKHCSKARTKHSRIFEKGPTHSTIFRRFWNISEVIILQYSTQILPEYNRKMYDSPKHSRIFLTSPECSEKIWSIHF